MNPFFWGYLCCIILVSLHMLSLWSFIKDTACLLHQLIQHETSTCILCSFAASSTSSETTCYVPLFVGLRSSIVIFKPLSCHQDNSFKPNFSINRAHELKCTKVAYCFPDLFTGRHKNCLLLSWSFHRSTYLMSD